MTAGQAFRSLLRRSGLAGNTDRSRRRRRPGRDSRGRATRSARRAAGRGGVCPGHQPRDRAPLPDCNDSDSTAGINAPNFQDGPGETHHRDVITRQESWNGRAPPQGATGRHPAGHIDLLLGDGDLDRDDQLPERASDSTDARQRRCVRSACWSYKRDNSSDRLSPGASADGDFGQLIWPQETVTISPGAVAPIATWRFTANPSVRNVSGEVTHSTETVRAPTLVGALRDVAVLLRDCVEKSQTDEATPSGSAGGPARSGSTPDSLRQKPSPSSH